MEDRFAQALELVPHVSLDRVHDGRPSPLLAGGGIQLGELLALAELPQVDGLPPPRRGIHGLRHLRMVAVLAVRLALAEGWDASRREHRADLWCLWVAGCLHDLGRRHDGIDWGHAGRGAKIAEAYLERCAVDEDAAALVVRLILNHGKGDESRFERIDRVFKDADGLDRHRLSPWDLDESRLRTATARSWSREIWSLYWKRGREH